MKKKILFSLIMGMFLLSFASAVNWDNKMKYDSVNEEIVVNNFFGLGNDLIKARLDNNGCDNQGRYCQASLPITLYNDGQLIEDRRFYRITEDNTYLSNIRWSKLEYWNGNNWIEFNEEDEFKAGEYLVSFSGEIKPGWQYDWQLKIKGKWTTPWAVWGNISEGDDAEVILNSPADESIAYENPVTFNASVNITGGAYIDNMSLWTNESGSWVISNSSIIKNETLLWNIDNDIKNGIPNVGTSNAPTTFILNSDLYMVIGINDGTFVGYAWNGSGWTTNSTIISGLTDVGAGSTPNVFEINGTYYLISGESDGVFNGWKWTGSGWTTNSTIISGLTDVGTNSALDVFTLGGEHYALVGGYDTTIGGWKWTGSGWTTNSTIINGQTGTIYYDAKPTVFILNDYYYLIYGIGFSGSWASKKNEYFVVQEYTETLNFLITQSTLWNIQACDSDGDCGFAVNNYTVNPDLTAPNITITYPTAIIDYKKTGDNLTLNYSVEDMGTLDSCWYEYNSINNTVNCTANTTEFTLNSDDSLTFYANDSFSNLASEVVNLNYKVFENNRTLNNESLETQSETFTINLTANTSLTSIKLLYNGTEYATTKTGTVYSTTLDIPDGNIGNNSIRWKFTYAGDIIYSDYSYQQVSETIFVLCNSTYTDKFINFTFKDEADFEILNATIPLATFNYYLGSGNEYKTMTYTNNTANYEYDFCSNVGNEILNIDYTLQYSGEDYPQRIAQELMEITTNITDKILYLLNVAEGLYVTFQVINTAEQSVEGVSVNTTREIAGDDVLVGVGNTNAGGSITFWLNPDFLHSFNFYKTGYDLLQTSLYPTQTIYTISIGGGTPDAQDDYSRGISYDITPKDTLLTNNTNYTFELEFLSAYWTIDSFGFYLYDENNTLITSESLADNGGTLSSNQNTNNNSNITMIAYWIVDGNSTNVTRIWTVYDDEAGNSLSIKAFFTDLTTYVNSGLFGLDNFGLGILLFLVIFGTTGIISWKFGIRSPAAISGMLFLLVLLFDVGLGMFTNLNPVGAVEHFPTIFVGFITLGLLIKEGVQ